MEDSSFTIPADDSGDTELDPRIQVELEKLNAATDKINKLELELDEATKTFHLLLGETSRRLQSMSKKLGVCVDKSRPYYEALNTAANARSECQKAAVQFQRASELHAAAKETVTLAEQRFVSKQDEWQFDSTWQEVLNHAIIKVMDAENRKAESGREHQKKANIYIAAERKVTLLEDNLKRHIIKSRIYFEEKKLCDEQLNTQNEKIINLQKMIAAAKYNYSKSLKALEEISEEIHRRRGVYPCKDAFPVGPREPGVGAEHEPEHVETDTKYTPDKAIDDDSSLQELRMRVRELALKPIDKKDSENDEAWAVELNETINKLDQLLMMKENNQQKRSKFTTNQTQNSAPSTSTNFARDTLTEPNILRTKSLSRSREAIYESGNITKLDKSKSMMSLDVLALARDTTIMDRESYLKAVIEDKSPTGTYTESNSDRNDTPDEILMVECDADNAAQTPVIRMTSANERND